MCGGRQLGRQAQGIPGLSECASSVQLEKCSCELNMILLDSGLCHSEPERKKLSFLSGAHKQLVLNLWTMSLIHLSRPRKDL